MTIRHKSIEEQILALWDECYSVEQIVNIIGKDVDGEDIVEEEDVENIIEDSTNYKRRD